MSKIAILLGSLRRPGNGIGLASWLTPIVRDAFNQSRNGTNTEVVLVDPTIPPFPLGPITDGKLLPASVKNADHYASPSVRQWSRFVSSCDAFVVLSPEYNGSYPGELKNTIDHLYNEWRGKPALVVTYGSGGGSGSSAQLRTLLGRLKLRVADQDVKISLPKQYVGADEKVPVEGPAPDFLKKYEPEVLAGVEEIRKLVAASPSP